MFLFKAGRFHICAVLSGERKHTPKKKRDPLAPQKDLKYIFLPNQAIVDYNNRTFSCIMNLADLSDYQYIQEKNMLTEKLTYEDIVTKTVEALFGAGLNRRTIQDSYCKYYGMLGKYLDARGIRHYDSSSIGDFLQLNEERYRKKEIKKHHYCGLKRAIRILIEYVEGDVIVSPTIRHV